MKEVQIAQWLILANCCLVAFSLPRPNDPCAGLPLCRRKGEAAPPKRRLTPKQPSLPVSEPDTDTPTLTANDGAQIVSAVSLPNEETKSPKSPRPPTRRTLTRPTSVNNAEVSDSACAGLILCKLSKDTPSSGNRVRRPPLVRGTTTRAPLVPDEPQDLGFFSESLMSAVLNNHLEEAKLLIEQGSDVNAEDVHGNSVLHIAAQNGRTDIIDDLVLNDADVNKGNNHKNTALHLAAQNGWTEIAEKLLKHRRIKVNFADFHGNTALHLAAQNGQLGVTRHLIEAEADLDRKNTHRHVPLHLAAQNGHFELSQLLAAAGANPNSKDLQGKAILDFRNTPLHTAYHTSHSQIAQMLIGYGADPNAKNLSGLQPAQLAG
ncbi:hypothetical protein TCAL_08622 [Tigriopus californicus]|uniref:Uncharacterized protein n=1 Tax=Tigriopus californicus TaxID=6832 RepID=A0A553PJW1_TIGCA|nr:hypothetical protein TCAL_08622 [Tigriopus californicus]